MIMSLFKRLHAEGMSVCLVTHDDRFLHLADRRLQMLDGKMVREEHAYAN
jgi:putative ABC transport system ATP-binding protein